MKRMLGLFVLAFVAATVLAACSDDGGGSGSGAWLREVRGVGPNGASDVPDLGWGIATDNAGNVYVAGWTDGTLPGSPTTNQGAQDGFLAKFSSSGGNVWTRQLGSSGTDIALSAAVDNAGNVYVAGSTAGTLPGSPTANQGSGDLFLVKFSSSGDNVWARQLGSSGYDISLSVAVDNAGNVYVAGWTDGTLPGSPTTNQGAQDGFLAKFSSSGDIVWTRQLGTSGNDIATSVAVDGAGNLYVAGWTNGTLPGSPTANQGDDDLFLVKYSSSGDNVWTRLLGSSGNDFALSVAVDNAGNVYVAGSTNGTLPGSPTANLGSGDLFLVKFSSSGDNVWTRQFGSSVEDRATSVAVDSAGNVYVAGNTNGTLPGSPTANQGGDDLFLAKFSSSGDNVWARELGSSGDDIANSVAVDGAGNVYVAGYTFGSLDGTPKTGSDSDVVILKYLPDGCGP